MCSSLPTFQISLFLFTIIHRKRKPDIQRTNLTETIPDTTYCYTNDSNNIYVTSETLIVSDTTHICQKPNSNPADFISTWA